MDQSLKRYKEQMLKMINEDLDALYYEMKELDRQYVERQIRVRKLKKRKDEILNLNMKENIYQ